MYCDVEPKRKALAQANAELAAAQDKLTVIKRKVAVSSFVWISTIDNIRKISSLKQFCSIFYGFLWSVISIYAMDIKVNK